MDRTDRGCACHPPGTGRACDLRSAKKDGCQPGLGEYNLFPIEFQRPATCEWHALTRSLSPSAWTNREACALSRSERAGSCDLPSQDRVDLAHLRLAERSEAQRPDVLHDLL